MNKSKDIITNYKAILSETETSYKDLQNYFLVIIYNKLKNIINKFQEEQKKLLNKYSKRRDINEKISTSSDYENENLKIKKDTFYEEIKEQEKLLESFHKQISFNFTEILELTFFIYTVLPRVSYSIKVCQILYRIIDFVKNQESTKQTYLSDNKNIMDKEVDYIGINFDKKHEIFKKVFDSISLVFRKSKAKEYAEVETLYLLQIVRELGVHYQFNEELIIQHFRISIENGSKPNNELNYFTIISILNYVKRDERFSNTRRLLRQIILCKFEDFESNKAENVMLLIDVLNCPYIAKQNKDVKDFKIKILNQIKFFDSEASENEKNNIIENIIAFTSDWFFSWKENDLGIELNTKRGHDVY